MPDPTTRVSSSNRRRLRGILAISIAVVLAAAGGFYLYRIVWMNNFDVIVPAKAYRSAQPSAKDIAAWADRYGLKTVINLRGESAKAALAQEKAAASQAGLQMVHIRLSAVDLPSSLEIRKLARALENSPQPVLLHCRAGADRTGLASVMAAMAIGGQDYRTAKKQMSAYYLHFDNDRTHIGGVLNEYEEYCLIHGRDLGGWAGFREWVMEVYHPLYYLVHIEPPAELSARAGQTVPVRVKVANASGRILPVRSGTFHVGAFLGSTEEENPEMELGPRVDLSNGDIPPGCEVEVTLSVTAPAQAGTYDVHFDVVEEGVTWFARQGSPMGTMKLTVEP